jgi:hypothetical protein
VKPFKVKSADCSYEHLLRIAERRDFVIVKGKKHYKVKTRDGKFITTIPRHTRLKREIVKGIVECLNRFIQEPERKITIS